MGLGRRALARDGAAGVAHGAQVPRSARQGRHGVAAGVVLLRAGQAHGAAGGQRAAVGRDGAAVGLQQRAGGLGDFRRVAQRLAARGDLLVDIGRAFGDGEVGLVQLAVDGSTKRLPPSKALRLFSTASVAPAGSVMLSTLATWVRGSRP
jgi:hypothetical protein